MQEKREDGRAGNGGEVGGGVEVQELTEARGGAGG